MLLESCKKLCLLILFGKIKCIEEKWIARRVSADLVSYWRWNESLLCRRAVHWDFSSYHGWYGISSIWWTWSSHLTLTFKKGVKMVIFIIPVVTLIVQFVMGLLLYFLWFKQRNMTICFVWIIVACINFTIQWIALVVP